MAGKKRAGRLVLIAMLVALAAPLIVTTPALALPEITLVLFHVYLGIHWL